jgi:hypothetical protein
MVIKIKEKFEDRFRKYGERVLVNERQTLELYDQHIIISTLQLKDFLNETFNAANVDDEIERLKLFDFFSKNVHFFDDRNTRQAVYQPKYEGNASLAACLSAIQLIIRRDTLNCHVFIRSQNFDKNFFYDCQTFCMLIKNMAQRLHTEQGDINIKIVSLHKIIS